MGMGMGGAGMKSNEYQRVREAMVATWGEKTKRVQPEAWSAEGYQVSSQEWDDWEKAWELTAIDSELAWREFDRLVSESRGYDHACEVIGRSVDVSALVDGGATLESVRNRHRSVSAVVDGLEQIVCVPCEVPWPCEIAEAVME